METSPHDTSARAGGLSRRTIVKNAAWAAPVIAVSTATSASAASVPVGALTLSFTQEVYSSRPGAAVSIVTIVRDPSGYVPGAVVRYSITEIEAGETAPEPEEPEDGGGSSLDPTAAFGVPGGPATATAVSLSNGYAMPPTVYVGKGLGVLLLTATTVVNGKAATATAYLRVMSVGSAYAVGYGGTGQMGNGSLKNNPVPSGIALPSGIKMIGTGPYRTGYAIDDSGVAWSWGSDYGHQQAARKTQKTPVAFSGLPRDVIQMEGSYYAGFALTAGGDVYGWGYQKYYIFANGNNSKYLDAPTRLTAISDVTKLAGSWRSMYAIRSDGTLWSWGTSSSGSLGLGSASGSARVPTQIRGFPAGRRVIDVSGRYHGGIALLDDGTVWCWGYNGNGSCGVGHTRAVNMPTQVASIRNAVRISAGWYNSGAVLSDGRALVWGKGSYYNLGNNDRSASSVPIALGLSNVKELAWGCETGHALTTSGSVFGWGYNGNHEVGLGYKTSRVKTPQRIPGLASVSAIASTMYATYFIEQQV